MNLYSINFYIIHYLVTTMGFHNITIIKKNEYLLIFLIFTIKGPGSLVVNKFQYRYNLVGINFITNAFINVNSVKFIK